MSKQREALKLALEALEGWGKGFPDNWGDLDTEAVTAIKEALAQPEQEPVAKVIGKFLTRKDELRTCIEPELPLGTTLYTSPPQRKPLTKFDRFNGVDIQFRKSGTDWPKQYRVTVMTNKNERDEYRVTVFCDTLNEAIEAAHNIKE